MHNGDKLLQIINGKAAGLTKISLSCKSSSSKINESAYTWPNIETEDTEHTLLSSASNSGLCWSCFALADPNMTPGRGGGGGGHSTLGVIPPSTLSMMTASASLKSKSKSNDHTLAPSLAMLQYFIS